MRVRAVMEDVLLSFRPETTYEEAAMLLFRHKFSGAPVVDENGAVVGMVSEKVLFRVLYPYYKSFYESPDVYTDFETRESKAQEIRHHQVSTFMTRQVMTVDPDAPLMRAGALMLAHHIHLLPVVEKGKLIAILRRGVLYRALLQKNFPEIAE